MLILTYFVIAAIVFWACRRCDAGCRGWFVSLAWPIPAAIIVLASVLYVLFGQDNRS